MALSAVRISMGGALPRGADGKQRGERDQRDGHEVLEQQHGKRHAAVAQRQLALLLQHLQGEGRRRQRQRQAGEHRDRPGQAAGQGDDGRAAVAVMATWAPPSAEDGGAHGPQPLGPQLQADQEQQQHHAELGKVQDRAHLVDGIDEAQPERADQHADQQVAQHVADAQQLGQRRRHHGGGQEQRDLGQGHVGHGGRSGLAGQGVVGTMPARQRQKRCVPEIACRPSGHANE